MAHNISKKSGEVRRAPTFISVYSSCLDTINSCGWHRVNDLYRITRQGGTDDFLLLLTVSGEGRAYIGENSYVLERDSLLIIPPQIPSGYRPREGSEWEFYWVHISGKNAELILRFIVEKKGCLQKSAPRDIAAYFEQLIASRDGYPEGGLFAAATASKILFGMMYACEVLRTEEEQLIASVIDEIQDEKTTALSLESISKKHFVSKEHLIRLFKKNTGTTPYCYYRKYKMAKSTYLLTYTQYSIREIAARTGFSDTASYSMRFLREFGISPSKYRLANRVCKNDKNSR